MLICSTCHGPAWVGPDDTRGAPANRYRVVCGYCAAEEYAELRPTGGGRTALIGLHYDPLRHLGARESRSLGFSWSKR